MLSRLKLIFSQCTALTHTPRQPARIQDIHCASKLCIEFSPVLATVQTPFQKLTFKIMEIQPHNIYTYIYNCAHPSGPIM